MESKDCCQRNSVKGNKMDNAINDIVVQLVDYQISEWKADGEEIATNNGDSLKTSGPPIRKLFVSNLSAKTSFYQLRSLFSMYGKVVEAYISRDRITHMKKKYGFVTFRYPEDAERVLKLKRGELVLHQRTLFVAPADSWHQPVELPDGKIRWRNRQRRDSQDSPTDSKDVSVKDSALPDEEQEEEEEIETGDCKINILNDDCLRHVFSFLNKRERVRIERVCKRWRTLSMDMWLCQKHLDFTSVLPVNSKYVLNMHVLESFLRRCGENISSLDVSIKPNAFTADVPKLIARYCKNLRRLNLSGLPVTSYTLRYLRDVCSELNYLCMKGCSGANDRDYESLFRACPRLETVSLAFNTNIRGKCLYGLKETSVKHLVLDECNNLRSKNLISALRELKSLSHLSLNTCVSLSGSDICILTETLPGLLSLSLAQYFPLLRSNSLKTLGCLHDLINLNLQLNPSVNDEVMESITQNCKKLEQLNITGCSVHSWQNMTLTDKGVKCLSSLPKLLDLKMSYLACVTDESLEAIACKCNLKSLVCRGCPTFTDVGCTRIITSCSELELFDFSGCDLVSNTTLEAALDAVKLRTNNIKLKLIVGGTCIYEDQPMEKHPLLDVDFNDFCVPHLRPDYVDDIYFPSVNDDDDDFVDSDDMLDHMIDEFAMYGECLESMPQYGHSASANRIQFQQHQSAQSLSPNSAAEAYTCICFDSVSEFDCEEDYDFEMEYIYQWE